MFRISSLIFVRLLTPSVENTRLSSDSFGWIPDRFLTLKYIGYGCRKYGEASATLPVPSRSKITLRVMFPVSSLRESGETTPLGRVIGNPKLDRHFEGMYDGYGWR